VRAAVVVAARLVIVGAEGGSEGMLASLAEVDHGGAFGDPRGLRVGSPAVEYVAA
jgi:hypothetical protein